MDKQEYAIFCEHRDDRTPGLVSYEDKTLDECLQNFAAYYAESWLPVSWMAGDIYMSEPSVDTARASSIAAGRLIENIDGQWVARGVEEPVSMTPTLDKLEAEKQVEPTLLKQLRDLVAAQGADGNWNHDDYMCGLYNGLELALAIAEGRDPQYRTLSAPVVLQAPVSTAKPNPFASFRNPDSCNGPADHLNAARHQMASIKG